MADPALAEEPDLEVQLAAPLLESRQRDNNWRIWRHLPRRDSSLAAFLVKSAEVLASGILTLNVFNATHFLAASPTKNDVRLGLCFKSSSNLTWKVFVLAIPFVLYPITLWISGMAKMAESDRRGLSAVSFAVIVEYIWVILASGLLVHCISEADYFLVAVLMVIAIGLLFIVWTITFNHPKCLRKCFCNFCCCGLAPDIAAAEANHQSIAVAELARQVARAQGAFAAQGELETEACAAITRALQAADAHKVAVEEVAKALQDLEAANRAMRAAEDDMELKKAAKAEADRVINELKEKMALDGGDPVAEASEHESITEVEQNTSTPVDQEADPGSGNYASIAQAADKAIKQYEDAVSVVKGKERSSLTADFNLVRATFQAQAKKKKAREVFQNLAEATSATEAAYKNAAAARSVAML